MFTYINTNHFSITNIMDNNQVQPKQVHPSKQLQFIEVLIQQQSEQKQTESNPLNNSLQGINICGSSCSSDRKLQSRIQNIQQFGSQISQQHSHQHFPLTSVKEIFSASNIKDSNLTEKQLIPVCQRNLQKQRILIETSQGRDIFIMGTKQDSNTNLRSFYYLILLSIFSYPEDSISEIKFEQNEQKQSSNHGQQVRQIQTEKSNTQSLWASSKKQKKCVIKTQKSIHKQRLKKLKMTIFSQNVDLTLVMNVPQIRLESKDGQYCNQRIVLTNHEYKKLLLEFINFLQKQCSCQPCPNQQYELLIQGQDAKFGQQQYLTIPHIKVYQAINRYPIVDVMFSMLIRAILFKRFQIEEAKDYRSFIRDHNVYSCLCEVFQISTISLQNEKCTVFGIFDIWTFNSSSYNNKDSLSIIKQSPRAQEADNLIQGIKNENQTERLLEQINDFDFNLDLGNIKIPDLDLSKASTANTVSKIYFLTVPRGACKSQTCELQYDFRQLIEKQETNFNNAKSESNLINSAKQHGISLKDLGSHREGQLSFRETLKDDVRQSFKQKLMQLIKINEKVQESLQNDSQSKQSSFIEDLKENEFRDLRIQIPSLAINSDKMNVSPQNGKQVSINNKTLPGSTTIDRSFSQLTPKSNSFTKSGTELGLNQHKKGHSNFTGSSQQYLNEQNALKQRLNIKIPKNIKYQQYDRSNLNSQRTAGFAQSFQNTQRNADQLEQERVRVRKSYDHNGKRFVYKQLRISSQETDGYPSKFRNRKSQDMYARTPVRVPIKVPLKINYPKYMNHIEFLHYISPGSRSQIDGTPTSLHSYLPDSPSMDQLKLQYQLQNKEGQFAGNNFTFNKPKGYFKNLAQQTYEISKQNRLYNQNIRINDPKKCLGSNQMQKIIIKNEQNFGCINLSKGVRQPIYPKPITSYIPYRNIPMQKNILQINERRYNIPFGVKNTRNIIPSTINFQPHCNYQSMRSEAKNIKVSFNYINRPI